MPQHPAIADRPFYPDRVQGYMVSGSRDELGRNEYHHLALFADGRVAITERMFLGNEANYDKPGRAWRWTTIEDVGLHELEVYWCGNYPAPTKIR